MLPSGSAVVPRMMPTLDREGLVEEVFLAVDFDDAHEIVGGAFVDLAAAEARVDEGAEPDPGEGARLAGGDVPVQVGDDPLGQVVALDAVRDGQLLQARHQAPVPADHALHQPFVAQVVEAAVLAVALAGAIDEGQALGLATAVRVLLAGVEEALFQRDGDILGEADADKAGGGHGVAGADQAHGVGGADDLAGVAALGAHQFLVLRVHLHSSSGGLLKYRTIPKEAPMHGCFGDSPPSQAFSADSGHRLSARGAGFLHRPRSGPHTRLPAAKPEARAPSM
jgi:hypothetical protein